ncbi:hypothetical protein FRB91_004481 [Serendipita sp. 411]|nr:hypothetical protein FRB91_004481 [Serendipita sp. 411]
MQRARSRGCFYKNEDLERSVTMDGSAKTHMGRTASLWRTKVSWFLIPQLGEGGGSVRENNGPFVGFSFWSRQPTGREFTAMTMVYFIHGATGISPWIAPTTAAIMDAATRIAKALPNITPFLAHTAVTKHNPKLELVLSSTRDESTFATHDQIGSTFPTVSEEGPINGVVAAQWDTPNRGSLLIVVNLLDRPLRVSVSPTNDNLKTRRTEMLLSEGVEIQRKEVEMGNELLVDVEAVGSAVIVLT